MFFSRGGGGSKVRRLIEEANARSVGLARERDDARAKEKMREALAGVGERVSKKYVEESDAIFNGLGRSDPNGEEFSLFLLFDAFVI